MLRFYMTHENPLAGEQAAVFAVFPVALVRAVEFVVSRSECSDSTVDGLHFMTTKT